VDCDVTGSSAPLGGGAFVAGAIDVVRGTWSGNTASSNGGGIAVAPGASATVTEATIAKNASSGFGGGIVVYNADAQLTLVRSLVGASVPADANQAPQGGGIALLDGATATIENSTISGNTAGQSGGGILCDSAAPCFEAKNVTIAKNNVTSGSGGGVAVTNAGGASVIINAILADNTPDDCSGPLCGAPNLVE
jgi:predicted outer membrane repeat protein